MALAQWGAWLRLAFHERRTLLRQREERLLGYVRRVEDLTHRFIAD